MFTAPIPGKPLTLYVAAQECSLVKIKFVFKNENREADILANLAVILARSDEDIFHTISIVQRWVILPLLPENLEKNNNVDIIGKEVDDWRKLLIDYFQHHSYRITLVVRRKFGDVLLALSSIRTYTDARLMEYAFDA
ncbi:Uncharacterized protein Adt_27456 [Abeliophyllum distichum]|uniref:Uncharacterized protein n=1 Tax=Abeliophyllum distichum TaxID=126358 RepID=A0ABD1RVT7_9LAMI